jgi:hypothetical protein
MQQDPAAFEHIPSEEEFNQLFEIARQAFIGQEQFLLQDFKYQQLQKHAETSKVDETLGTFTRLYSKSGDNILVNNDGRVLILIASPSSSFGNTWTDVKRIHKSVEDKKRLITFLDRLCCGAEIIKGIDMERFGDCKLFGLGVNQKHAVEHEKTCFRMCHSCGIIELLNSKPHTCNPALNNISIECRSERVISSPEWNMKWFDEVDLKSASSRIQERDMKGMCVICSEESSSLVKTHGCVCKEPAICFECWIETFRQKRIHPFATPEVNCPCCKK